MSYEGYHGSRFQYKKKRERVWKILVKYIQKDIPDQACVLDAGAGYCHFINNICAQEKHALDIFEDIVNYAGEGVVAHVGSCTDLTPFDSNSFDIVFASNLFEHLTEPEFAAAIEEIKRVLKNRGRLIVLQPNFKYCYRQYFDDYTHKTIYTEKSMSDRLTAAGFRIRKCIPRLVPFSVESRIPVILPLIEIYLMLPFRPLAKQMYIVAESAKG